MLSVKRANHKLVRDFFVLDGKRRRVLHSSGFSKSGLTFGRKEAQKLKTWLKHLVLCAFLWLTYFEARQSGI